MGSRDHSELNEAARQRAAPGMRVPDAVRVATALAAGGELFLTNDCRLKLPSGLAKELLVSNPSSNQSEG